MVTAVVAGTYDLRFRRIPNWLNMSAVILGIGMNTFLSDRQGLTLAILGIVCSLMIYFPLYLLRGMGAGDVKLMAAVGAIAGPGNWLRIFIATALLGGLLSVLLVGFKKRFHETWWNVVLILSELMHGRRPSEANASLDIRDRDAVGMPHGAVVAIGAFAFLLLF